MRLTITCEVAGERKVLTQDGVTSHDLTVIRNIMDNPPAKVFTVRAREGAYGPVIDHLVRAGDIRAVDVHS